MNIVDEKMLCSEMKDGKEYVVQDLDFFDYEYAALKKVGYSIYVRLLDEEQKEIYTWNFDLRILDILTDDEIEFGNNVANAFYYDYRNDFKRFIFEKATLENLEFIQSKLNSFLLSLSLIPKSLKSFVELPN